MRRCRKCDFRVHIESTTSPAVAVPGAGRRSRECHYDWMQDAEYASAFIALQAEVIPRQGGKLGAKPPPRSHFYTWTGSWADACATRSRSTSTPIRLSRPQMSCARRA